MPVYGSCINNVFPRCLNVSINIWYLQLHEMCTYKCTYIYIYMKMKDLQCMIGNEAEIISSLTTIFSNSLYCI